MIRIVVDSASDYLPEELEEKKIESVPLILSFGGKSYRDGEDLTREEFYRLLKDQKEFPKTSQPSPEDFLALFHQAKEAGDEVICILISSALSGTYQSAFSARQMAEYEKIYLVDSLTAAAGIQFLADEACRMRDAGERAEKIVIRLEHIKERIRVYFIADTLEYLYRGGRLSKTGMISGRAVNLKPVLTLNAEGKVAVSDYALGEHRAVQAILKHLKKTPPDPAFPLCTLFSSGTDNVKKLEEDLLREGYSPGGRKQIGGVIGAHIGPGAAGIFYMERK